MQIGHEHGCRQLILAQDPIESLDNGVSRFQDPVLLCELEECRSHAVLMDRIDLVEIENPSACSVEKPRPLAIRTLPFNQFPSACICDLNCPIIVHQLTISVAGEQQIGLSRKRCVPPPWTEGRIEKQSRWGIIMIEQKCEQSSRHRRPFFSIDLGLGHHPDYCHAKILSAEGLPLTLVGKHPIDMMENVVGKRQPE